MYRTRNRICRASRRASGIPVTALAPARSPKWLRLRSSTATRVTASRWSVRRMLLSLGVATVWLSTPGLLACGLALVGRFQGTRCRRTALDEAAVPASRWSLDSVYSASVRGGIAVLFALLASGLLTASDWTRFRGPNGSGVHEGGALPVEFGPAANIRWAAELPPGKSSPILTSNRVFVTAHQDGRLLTLAIDRSNGKVLWSRAAPERRSERMHRLNDEASPTPVTDGTNVYAFFGGYGLVAYGPTGDQLWTLPLGPFTNFHGMASSPILVGGKLVLVCDQDLEAYVIAVDPADGEILWKRSRPDFVHSFSTPVVHARPQDSPEIIVPGSYRMTSYTLDGQEAWRVDGLTYQVKSGAVLDNERLYFNGWAPGGEPAVRLELPAFEEMHERFDSNSDTELAKDEVPEDWLPSNWEMHDRNKNGTLDARDWAHYRARRVSENACMAIRLGGRGNITNSHMLWRHRKSLPDVASPILYRDVLYLVRNGGIVTALEPASGKVLKQGRLRQALDGFYSSPVAGDGKVYMVSDTGKAVVIAAGADWKVLQTNDLEEAVYATPAIGDGCLYIRTASRLYCFSGSRRMAAVREQGSSLAVP